jgi:translation initiation factor 4G
MFGFPESNNHDLPVTYKPEIKQIPSFSELLIKSVEFIPVSKMVLNIEAEEFQPLGQCETPKSLKPSPQVILPEVPKKKVYPIEEILEKLEDFLGFQEFSLLQAPLLKISQRKVQVFKVFNRGKGKKQRSEFVRIEEFKAGQIERWRKVKSEEEKKIHQKALENTLKLTKDKEENEKIRRKIKITLNKLSPSNCEKLQVELVEYAKSSRDNLVFLIENVFEKAWSEVKYTEMYAKLCKYLKQQFEGFLFNGESPSKKNKNWLRYILLNTVQNAFECDPELKPDQNQSNLIQKKKSHGSARFIGELLKVRIITAKIIQQIVEHLINLEHQSPLKINEDKIEVACVMISTMGSVNEKPKLIQDTLKIFSLLNEILEKNQKISSQLKYRIMDLIDERKSGWIKDCTEQPKLVEEFRCDYDYQFD